MGIIQSTSIILEKEQKLKIPLSKWDAENPWHPIGDLMIHTRAAQSQAFVANLCIGSLAFGNAPNELLGFGLKLNTSQHPNYPNQEVRYINLREHHPPKTITLSAVGWTGSDSKFVSAEWFAVAPNENEVWLEGPFVSWLSVHTDDHANPG